MKKNLFIAVMLSLVLFSCRPKVIYVDRPVSTPSSTPSSNDNQVYQPPAGAAYTPPANTSQQYDNGQYNNNQQQYNSNQNYQQESDQQYYANQQQVNYGSSSYQTFYDELSPYGSWVNYQGYGYVWAPAQGPGFTPYATNGYWAYTQYGMTWVSNYNWGWAPFHYGSWLQDPYYGWLWIPGNTWAPAQVVWGQYNGYYGWAPIGPGYNAGYRPAANYWNFVPQGHVCDHDVNSYVVSHENNNVIINNNVTNITIVNHDATYNNNVYNAGPQREEIERVTGHPVQAITISETPKPLPANKSIANNNLTVYRPAISQATATHAIPARVVPIENVKTTNATAVHGVLPRQNTNTSPAQRRGGNLEINPAVRPSNQTQQRQPEPVQRAEPRPVQTTPQTRPVQESPQPRPVEERPQTRPTEPRPAQPQPTHNPTPTQNKPAPKPKPQPKPAATRPVQERR